MKTVQMTPEFLNLVERSVGSLLSHNIGSKEYYACQRECLEFVENNGLSDEEWGVAYNTACEVLGV